MMTAEQLTASILQLAMEGKLVEQRPEEGTGEELYQQIQAEKVKLVKEGKIKKQKSLPEISEDGKPFEIPESWKWVHLNYIAESSLGKTINKSNDIGTEVPYLCSINVYWSGIDRTNIKQTKFSDDEKKKYRLKKGDLLICEGGDIGRSAIWYGDEEMYYQNALHCVRFYQGCNSAFYWNLLELYKLSGIIDNVSKGVTIKHLVQGSLYSLWMPLPPLSEQRRIVQKIEELMPFVEEYTIASEKLDKLNSEFPDQVKKSILQLAVEGKLVEQRPEEGTGEELFRKIQEEKAKLIKEGKIKKQKPLAEITDDEKPFDIPDSWTWIRLKDLGEFSSGKTPSMSDVRNWQNGRVSWITSKDMKNKYLSISQMLISEYAASEMRLYPPNTMLMVVRSGILKRMLPVSILTANSTINQDIKAFSLYYPDICEYIYVVLKGMETYILQTYRKQVTTVDSLRFEDFQNMPIPIPPEQEQRRIILKLNTILPEIEQLNK